jgi:hypothetical protein
VIRAVSRYPFLTGLAIVLGGFFIFAAFLIISRVIVDPDHVVVTSYKAEGKKDDGKVELTINRVSYHPATKVRGLFIRQSSATARPEYVQVDGTVALSADFSGVMALVGPALIPVDSVGQLEREIRTRGNPCLSSGWPSTALQLKTTPSDFTIRIAISDDFYATTLLAAIRNGQMPPITLKGIYITNHKCEPVGVMMASRSHEITVEAISLAPGVVQDFYPYGLPRFREPGDIKGEYWKEWARGWVPGEF